MLRNLRYRVANMCARLQIWAKLGFWWLWGKNSSLHQKHCRPICCTTWHHNRASCEKWRKSLKLPKWVHLINFQQVQSCREQLVRLGRGGLLLLFLLDHVSLKSTYHSSKEGELPFPPVLLTLGWSIIDPATQSLHSFILKSEQLL